MGSVAPGGRRSPGAPASAALRILNEGAPRLFLGGRTADNPTRYLAEMLKWP